MEVGMFKKKKTDNVIEVLPGGTDTLQVNDHDVFQNSLKQVITWKLAKQLEQGDFISFEWVDPTPAPGTFDAPEISPDGNSMTIGDHNGQGARKGNLAYVIKVELNGTIYTCKTVSTQGIMRDPVIINK